MTENNPSWAMQGAIDHPALVARRQTAMILGEGVGSFEGLGALPDDLKVTENAPVGPNVLVKRGGGAVKGDSAIHQGVYTLENDADIVVPIPGVAGNPRIDLIVCQQLDTAYGGADDLWHATRVPGTENANPVAPALPPTALLLAEVRSEVGVPNILNAKITDRRVAAPLVAAVGQGIMALSGFNTPNLGASQTNLQVDRVVEIGAAGTIGKRDLGICLPWAGSIVGISWSSNVAKTAGTATFKVYKNGAASNAQATWANGLLQAAAAFARGTYPFVVGDLLQVRVTTDAAFAPSAQAEVEVTIWAQVLGV